MPLFPRLHSLALAAALACLAAPAAAQGAASAPLIEFALPAGALDQSLSQIARQSGRSIVVDSALVRGRQAAAVQGRLSAEEAMRRALAGSGLELVVGDAGALSLRPAAAAPAPAQAANAGTLQAITVQAGASASPYVADRPSSVATKTELPPRLTPFSVNQASEALIVERGDQNIYETLERFSGVTGNNGQSDIGINMDRYLSIRGFASASSNTGQMLINGQRTFANGGGMRGTDSLESVELLRGPASLYYGAAEPGGVFNYNYKRPRAQAAYTLRGRVDSEGGVGTMADLAGPLNADATLRYRLVGSFTRNQEDQAHVWSRPNSLLAAVQWAPHARFETTLTYERLDLSAVPEKENNKQTANGQYYPIPVKQSFLGHLNDRAERESDTLIWDAAWKPSDRFKLSANLMLQRAEQWYQVTRPSGSGGGGTPPDPDALGNIPRSVSFSPPSQWRNFSAGVDASGKFATGDWRHEWLVGGGFGEGRSRSQSRATLSGEFDSGGYRNRQGRPVAPGRYAALPFNIHGLNNGYWPWRDLVTAQSAYMVPWAERKDTSVYLQDLVHLPNGRTRLFLGLGWSRYDNLARGSYNWTTRVRGQDTPHKADKWTPRLAVMHDITPSATIYASYGESFAPQPSLTRTDRGGAALLTPEEGVQYEIGYKQDLNEANGLFTAALFRIDKKNIARAANSDTCDAAATDPGDPFYCFYELDGLQRSQGLELSLSGELMPGWSASVNYTFLDTEIVDTADVYQRGRSFAAVPRHSLSVWNKFRLMQSAEYGSLWLGAGLRGQSSMHTAYNASGATRIGGFGVVDLGLFWQHRLAGGRDLRVNLNLNNAFNRTVYVGSSARPTGTLIYGPVRRLALTAQLSF